MPRTPHGSAWLRWAVASQLAVPWLAVPWLAACGHQPPPYARAAKPTPPALLAAAQPRHAAVSVAEAGIVFNRTIRGDLALLAQAPGRFRGSVSKGGNELVTLAFHEEGYALRYKLDALPRGYYAGPPSSCAVHAMLGVPLSPASLVATVLGGGPVLESPYEIESQAWDRERAVETLVLANASYEEELQFTWIGEAWIFQGAQLWARDAQGNRGRRLWALEHDRFEARGGVPLPDRTRIWAPSGNGEDLIVITYDARNLSPAWAESTPPTNPQADTPASTEPSEPATDSGGESTTDSGGESTGESSTESTGESAPESTGESGSGWEDDEGWENEDEVQANAAPTDPSAPGAGNPPGSSAPRPRAASAENRPAIPEVFRLEPTGLEERGDLCREASASAPLGGVAIAGP